MPRPVSPLTVKTGLGRTVNIVGYTTLHSETGTFVVVIDTDGNQYLVGFGDNDSFLMTNGDFDVPGSEADNFGSIPAAYSGEVVPDNNWNILFWLRNNANMSFDNTPLYDLSKEDYIDPIYSCVDYLLYIDDAAHSVQYHRVFNDGIYGNVHGDINCYGQTTGSQGGDEFCEIVDLANLSQEEGDIGSAFDTLILMLNRRFFYAYHELAVVTTAELERIMPNDGDSKYFRVDDSTGQYNDIVMKLFNEDGIFYSCGVYSTREEEDYQYRCNMYGDLYGSTMALEDIEEVTDRIIDMLGLRKSALESSDRLDVEYSVELPQLQELQRSDINDLRVSRNPLYVRTNLKTEDGLGAIVKITYTQAGFLATTCMREPAQEGQSPAVWAANVYGELGFIASTIAEGEEISNTFAEAYGIQQQDTAYVTRESINVTRQAVIIVPPSPVPPAPPVTYPRLKAMPVQVQPEGEPEAVTSYVLAMDIDENNQNILCTIQSVECPVVEDDVVCFSLGFNCENDPTVSGSVPVIDILNFESYRTAQFEVKYSTCNVVREETPYSILTGEILLEGDNLLIYFEFENGQIETNVPISSARIVDAD